MREKSQKYGMSFFEWAELCYKIRERDGRLCRICKKSFDRPLSVHHIVPYRKSKDNSTSNLMAVCRRHHGKLENDYRRMNGLTHFLRKYIEENKAIE